MRPLAALALFISAAAPLTAQETCQAPWHLEEDLRIGSVDGDVTLTWIRDLEVGPTGDMYVSQGFDHGIAVYGADGAPKGTIGRAGGGPGEFSSTPDWLGWRGDTLVAIERFGAMFLGKDGTELRRVSFRVPVLSESSTFMAGLPLADGSFLGHRYLNQPLWLFYEAERLPLRRFSEFGEVLDHITLIDQPPPVGDAAFRAEFPNRTLAHPLTYWTGDSTLRAALTRDGQAVVFVSEVRSAGDSTRYNLMKVDVGGDTILSRPIQYSPKPIPRQERAALRDGFAGQFAGDFAGANMTRPTTAEAERLRETARQSIEFPDEYPPVRAIVTGNDGTIWLLRESAPAPQDLWEVYSEDGILEGSIRITDGKSGSLPWLPRLRVLRASRDNVWGVTADDFDVPYIHRFRVVRSCS
jgi:hypothetical protein